MLALQGCASNDALAKKAAFTLGTSVDKVTISDIDKGVIRTEFKASVGKTTSSCYVTGGGFMMSDAICSTGGQVRTGNATMDKAINSRK